jgi:phage terminase Nu1 subunit (DNA packaging protein)
VTGNGRGLSVHALAEGLGVSRTAIQKAARQGRLKGAVRRDRKGHLVVVDVALARRLWKTERSRPAPVKVPTAKVEVEHEGENVSLVDAQVRATLARADAQELATQLKRGLLVERFAVSNRWFEVLRVLREAILNLAPRLHATVAAESDPQRCFALIDEEAHKCLEGVADTLEGMGI